MLFGVGLCCSQRLFKVPERNFNIITKTAEKGLQFGVHKCKTMVIGKSSENIHKNHLEVDKWEIVRKDENKTGKELFFEEFNGQVPIEKTEEQNIQDLSYHQRETIWQTSII